MLTYFHIINILQTKNDKLYQTLHTYKYYLKKINYDSIKITG